MNFEKIISTKKQHLNNVGDVSCSSTSESDNENNSKKKIGVSYSLYHLKDLIKTQLKDSEAEESNYENEIKRAHKQKVSELEFYPTDKITIQMDIYQLTIAANMTKDVPAMHLTYSIKICIFVFVIQLLLIYSFGVEKFDFNEIQSFDNTYTMLRFLMCLIM